MLVNPLLEEKEYGQLFVQTFQGLYYEKLCTSVWKSFSNLILQGEMIENGLKMGKITDLYLKTAENAAKKVATTRGTSKREGEVSAILPTQPYQQLYQPRPMVLTNQAPAPIMAQSKQTDAAQPYFFHSRMYSDGGISQPAEGQFTGPHSSSSTAESSPSYLQQYPHL